MQNLPYPVAVIGAGPIGLAVALHLLKQGIQPIVLERGHEVGHAIRKWGHVRLFSPWRYNMDANSIRRLKEMGWSEPDLEHYPTGNELVDQYIKPLANLPELKNAIKLGAKVDHVGRRDYDKVKTENRELNPFELIISSSTGDQYTITASSVIDASGTWFQPNPVLSGGIFTKDELAQSEKLFYGIPDVLGIDLQRYAGKKVMVVGSGHSALNTLQGLWALQRDYPETRVIWATRKFTVIDSFGSEKKDELPERGRLGAIIKTAVETGTIELISPFRARQLKGTEGGGLIVSGSLGNTTKTMPIDEVVVATGFRPDLEMLREVRLNIDSWLECPAVLAPLIDPNIHSCGTVRPHGAAQLVHSEEGFYILGMKSYGRAPTFLLATGYEQARSVAAAIAGDWEAAENIQLSLPSTGVCSSDRAGTEACC